MAGRLLRPFDGQPASLVTVPVDDAGVGGAPVRHTPPAPLDEEGRAMVGARVAAIAVDDGRVTWRAAAAAP